MILSFKKFDNLLLYLSLKVGVNFMNSQHLRLKWHFEKLDKYGPSSAYKAIESLQKMQTEPHNSSGFLHEPCVDSQWRNRNLSDFIKNILICVLNVKKVLQVLEQHEG